MGSAHVWSQKCIPERIWGSKISTTNFQDPAYLYMNKIKLSTSTLSSPNFILGGFCPVTEDGYGIGYGIQNNECGFNTSSYKERQDDELIPGLDDDKDPYANPELIDALLSAMEDIKKVFKSIP